MKKLVIFDLDGTLLNTIDDLGDATNYTLRQFGYPTFSTEEYKYKVGHGIRKLVERSVPEDKLTEKHLDELMAVFTPYYELHKADKTRPYEGMTSVLEQLQQHGVKIAVATNKIQEACEPLMKRYFPDIRFTAILGQRPGHAIKPDRSIVDEIIAIAGVERDQVLYVGDSNVDMQTAINAETEACGVTWGFRKRSEIEAFNPAHIIDSPSQITDIVLK